MSETEGDVSGATYSDADALLALCQGIGTSAWSDALDECEVEGVVRGLTKRAGPERFAGYARTAVIRAGVKGDFKKTDFGLGKVLDSVRRGEVLVIDLNGADISAFGGMAALAARQQGVRAVVIDGGCRDLGEIQASGLWLASRHVTPTTGSTRIRTESIGEPASIGGIVVHTGDLIVGDDTGLVVIPAAKIARVLEAVRKKLAVDAILESEIRAGRTFAEAAAIAKYM